MKIPIKPRIFVGSSSEHLSDAKQLCVWIEDSNCEPVLWSGAFETGDITILRLLELCRQVDAAVFLVADDDTTWLRGTKVATARDNVILELGLFAGAFGDGALKKAIICRVGEKTRVATDLAGVTYLQISLAKGYTAEQKFKNWCKTVVRRAEEDATIRHAKTKKDLFNQGTELISAAQNHVFLCAKTPIPLMGARPYDAPLAEKFDYEISQHKKYWEIARSAAKGQITLTIVASLPCMEIEFRQLTSPSSQEAVIQSIRKIYDLSSRPKGKLRLEWYDGHSPSTYLVADNSSLIWFKGPSQDNVWISDTSETLARTLRTQKLARNNVHVDAIIQRLKGAAANGASKSKRVTSRPR